ncbi:MAG: tyrosine-type recombinase/integrase [Verrucomicrobiota bacterium]
MSLATSWDDPPAPSNATPGIKKFAKLHALLSNDDSDNGPRPSSDSRDIHFLREPRQNPAPPLFVDLSPFLDGSAQQEVPTVAEVWDGRCLFYAGRLNEIHAEPGTGKTNILMVACNAVLDAGGHVLYIDPEDTPKGFTTRMLMLGADPEAIRERVHYLHNPTPEEILTAQRWAIEHKPDIAVFDGLPATVAKRKKARVVPFGKMNRIPAILQGFFDLEDGIKLSRVQVWNRVKGMASRAGITHPVTPHGLRATGATWFAMAGYSITGLMDHFGWSELRTAQHYVRASGASAMRDMESNGEGIL